MESGRCLIVLQSFDDRTVDDDFVVLQFTAHYPECVVLLVVKNLHLTQAGRTARRDPLFLAIVVHHDRGAGTDYALFTHHSLRCAPFLPNRTVPVCVLNCFRLSVPGSPSSSTFYATIFLFPKTANNGDVPIEGAHTRGRLPIGGDPSVFCLLSLRLVDSGTQFPEPIWNPHYTLRLSSRPGCFHQLGGVRVRCGCCCFCLRLRTTLPFQRQCVRWKRDIVVGVVIVDVVLLRRGHERNDERLRAPNVLFDSRAEAGSL